MWCSNHTSVMSWSPHFLSRWGSAPSRYASGSSEILWNRAPNPRRHTSVTHQKLKNKLKSTNEQRLSQSCEVTLKYVCRSSPADDTLEARLADSTSSWIHWIALSLNQSRSERKHTTTHVHQHVSSTVLSQRKTVQLITVHSKMMYYFIFRPV